MAYKSDPMNAITTKFVHMSMNKVRCPINVARVLSNSPLQSS